MKEKLKDRYSILSIFFLLMGIVILLRLANLQIVNGETYDQESQRKLVAENTVKAQRGNIVDRNGLPLAVSRDGFFVRIAKVNINEADRRRMYLKLVNILEKNGDSYKKNLSDYITFNPADFGPSLKDNETALKKWKKDLEIKSAEMDTPEELFNYLRKTQFKIEDEYNDEEAYKIMTMMYEWLINGYGGMNPIASDVSHETVAELEERHSEFPGITTYIQQVRKYTDVQVAAHVLGYVGPIFKEEYAKLKSDGYSQNDIIGKTGIEKSAEKFLRGTDGSEVVETDIRGRMTSELSGKPAVPGNEVVLTIDMELQKVAMESLRNKIELIRSTQERKNYMDANAGAVVAMDVNTGEVLAMASYPSYDPAVYLEKTKSEAAKKTTEAWESDKENLPLYNRAISGIYAPGSTFKPLTAVAALEEEKITPANSVRYDQGYLDVNNHRFVCLEYRDGGIIHGSLTLKNALATSCNIYFHQIAMETTIDSIDKWTKAFGLGEYTGIDLPGENKGIRANREYKKKQFKEDWWPADTAQAGIGQIYHAYTPIQLVNYISTIANGGKKFTPHLIQKAIAYDGSTVSGSEYGAGFEEIPLKPDTLAAVREGMIAVSYASDGTAVNIFNDLYPIRVASKTGTAETGDTNHSSNGFFVCYAPADNPQIAVAVAIERGVWGYNCASVAKDIIRQYFGLNDTDSASDTIREYNPVFVP